MRPSVEHVHKILKDDIEMLGGDAGRVVLMGFSQGGAMALVSWLLWQGQSLGAVFIMSGFMPLAETLAKEEEEHMSDDGMFERDDEQESKTPLQRAINELREEAELDPEPPTNSFPFLKTPVFMGHGQKDVDVEICHGQQAAMCLERLGIDVELRMYPDMAHWYCPEELGDIAQFITRRIEM
jgi:predicted esterase